MRKQRYERMVEVTQVLAFLGHPEPVSTANVAFWVGLKAGNHFQSIMKSCQLAGWIERFVTPHRPNAHLYTWKLTEAGRKIANASLYEYWVNPDNMTAASKPVGEKNND